MTEKERDETKRNNLPPEENQKKEGEKSGPVLTRRDLLKIGGATAAAIIVTEVIMTGPLSPEAIEGIQRETSHGGEASEHQWHMVIDLSKCIGCLYCVRACQAVNDVVFNDMRWNIVIPERDSSGTEFYMNRPCMHCQEAPCVRVCPVGATWIRADGIVTMDYDRCIGCRYCEVACPYGVRRFNWKDVEGENEVVPTWGTPEIPRRERGVVEKCSFCVQRIDRAYELGLTPGIDPQVTPACVEICPVNARIFGDINDQESPVSRYLRENQSFRLREDWGTEPKVHYIQPAKEA